jgi:hypothetical protein
VTIDGTTSREELAAIVCEALEPLLGRDIVLVGGAVVSIYTNDLFASDDLDFVNWKSSKQVAGALAPFGFRFTGNTGTHPDTRYFVQFLTGPVMVGPKHVKVDAAAERETRFGKFRLLSPLDCVLDRFAWYLHHNDMQALEQAARVAAEHAVNLDDVRQWLASDKEIPDRSKNLKLEDLINRITRLKKRP